MKPQAYLLYFAVFHGSRNDVCSYVTAMFVYKLLNKECCILIKNFSLLKGDTAQELMKEFPSKSWKKQFFLRPLK